MLEERIEVIGIDHGWSNMKTVNHVFVSGVKEMSTEPALLDNLVEYQNRYYKIGTNRMEVKDTKVTDESYYILTLVALAKELMLRGKYREKIIMGVGLPLTRFGAEKKDFIDYLSRQNEIHFKFEGKHFNLRVEKVMIYPQCYGAIVDKIGSFCNDPVVVDIGSWTIDIMPIIRQMPDEANCKTIPKGLITCIRDFNDEMVRVLNGEIPENMIEDVMKHSGKIRGENIHFIEDVKANAKGYEYLTRMSMRGKAGQ